MKPAILSAFTPIAILLMGLAGPGLAQDDENPEINYRQKYMASIGGHFGAARELVIGDVVREGHLAIHADALEALARDIPALFPESSAVGETAAKPAIWEQWDDFTARAGTAQEKTAAFRKAVAGGDQAQIAGAFKEVGQACRGCHEDYKRRD